MALCAVCLKNKAQYACSHSCHTLYCSPVCAQIDWSKQYHYLACGDFLDDLPSTALVEVLSNLSFADLFSSVQVSKKVSARFAFIITTYSFRKAFALKHRGEWEERVDKWFRDEKNIEYIMNWIPVLLDTNVWNPAYNYNSAIAKASAWNLTNIVQLLLYDSRVDPYPGLKEACWNDHADVVLILLEKVDPSVHLSALFRSACRYGQAKVVAVLLEDGRSDPTSLNHSPIRDSCKNGHVEVVKLLLKDPRVVVTNLALAAACANGQEDVVRLLLSDPRVDPRDQNDEALKEAIANGHADIVKLLQEKTISESTNK